MTRRSVFSIKDGRNLEPGEPGYRDILIDNMAHDWLHGTFPATPPKPPAYQTLADRLVDASRNGLKITREEVELLRVLASLPGAAQPGDPS